MPNRDRTHDLTTYFLIGIAGLIPALLFLEAIALNYGRLWGIAWWHHYSTENVLLFFVISLIVLVAVGLLSKRIPRESESSVSPLSVVVASLILIVSFIEFRTQTHFLGDGYALLGAVSGDMPFLKERNFGGMLLPYWLMHLLGGPSTENALLAYRIVSILAGVIFMAISYGISRALSPNLVDRFLIWLGLNVGGYSLLFFGYVENYAPFVVAVALFCYAGLKVEKRELRSWWLVPTWMLCPLMHVFGFALFPVFLYLILKAAPDGSFIGSRHTRLLIWTIVGLGGVLIFVYLYATNLFFRYAFVPLVKNRITVEGYTLFSPAHLLDFVNLLLVLSPALLLFLLFGARQFMNGLRDDIFGYRYLSLTSLCLLVVAFFINPQLGMPRDWDLFACAGVPLTMVVLVSLATPTRQRGRLALALAVTVSLIMLASRVAITADSTSGSRMALDYMRLDPSKNRTLGETYATFIQDRYGVDSTLAVQRQLATLWPDDLVADSGTALMAQGHYRPAADYFARATVMNALNYGAWANLGKCLIEQELYDSAATCLRIASGLNPYNSVIATMRGYAEYHTGKMEVAEKQWLLGRELDTTTVAPLEALARYYATTGNEALALAYLDTIVTRGDAPIDFLVIRVQQMLDSRRLSEARTMFERALKAGLDSSQAEQLFEAYPELR